MCKIFLYHKKQPTFVCIVSKPNPDDYILVGEFDYNLAFDIKANCEKVWTASQNSEESWKPNTRSTCVGDYMIVTDGAIERILFVDGFGMAEYIASEPLKKEQVMSNFFVMMNSQKGNYIMPLVDEDQEVALWPTLEEAKAAVKGNPYAEAFGYEIFERGTGDC
jgi:hypothetical protein